MEPRPGTLRATSVALVAAWTALGDPALRRREWRALALTLAAIAVAYAPWLLSLFHHLELTRAEWYFSGRLPAAAWPRAAGGLLASLLLGEEPAALGRPALAAALALLGAATLPLAARSFTGGLLRAEGAARARVLVDGPAAAATRRRGRRLARDAHALRREGELHAALRARAARGVRLQRGRGAPDHIVVVSAALQTYLQPLVRVLAGAGVERVALLHLPAEQLRAEGLRAIEATGARSATLVNFAVPYDPSATWDRALLRELEAQAAAAGWHPVRVQRSRAAGPSEAGDHALWLVGPVRVRYFPG
jgi:hypothetical protein